VASAVVGVQDVESLRLYSFTELKNPMGMRRVARRQRKNPEACALRASFECAALRANDELLVATLPQALGQK